jgi:hypothetical protein
VCAVASECVCAQTYMGCVRVLGAAHTASDSQRTPLGALIEALLHLHLIGDRLHVADGARYPHRAVDILARAHEVAQLNDALERLDFDTPGDLKLGILEIRSDRIGSPGR